MSALVAVCNRPALLTPWPRTFQFADLEPSPNLSIFQDQFFRCGLPLLQRLYSQPRSDHAWAPGKIAPEVMPLPYVKAGFAKETRDRVGLARADLEQGKTARTQGFAEARLDAAIGGKPVRPSIQRRPRIVIAHL